jgi:O-succinylbenzoic acid--CoA ligase
VLTRGNVAAAVESSQKRIGNSAADRWLLCLPLSHVAGLSIVWRSLAAGGCVVLHAGFDPVAVAGDLRSGRANMVSLVPTMLRRILHADPAPLAGIDVVLLGGAPAEPELITRAASAGLPVLQTYGMTETCSQVATVAPGETRSALGTVGRPLDGFSVTIRGDDDRAPDPGAIGEIVVDGPAVSPGYLGEAPRHGPHRTGDLGYLDPSGRLVVVGRLDDVIITGGENVYPDAVAAVVAALPGVRQCVVFGAPDEEWGEIVMAAVEVDDACDLDLAEAVKEHLHDYEVPKRWLEVPRMPLLANGKVDRDALETIADRRV